MPSFSKFSKTNLPLDKILQIKNWSLTSQELNKSTNLNAIWAWCCCKTNTQLKKMLIWNWYYCTYHVKTCKCVVQWLKNFLFQTLRFGFNFLLMLMVFLDELFFGLLMMWGKRWHLGYFTYIIIWPHSLDEPISFLTIIFSLDSYVPLIANRVKWIVNLCKFKVYFKYSKVYGFIMVYNMYFVQ